MCDDRKLLPLRWMAVGSPPPSPSPPPTRTLYEEFVLQRPSLMEAGPRFATRVIRLDPSQSYWLEDASEEELVGTGRRCW